MRRPLILFVLVALCRSAYADRDQQGEQLIRMRCGDCHVVGRGKASDTVPHGFVDLTFATKRHPDAWLTAWIKDPHAIKSDTRCYTAGLDGSQIEALLAFLHTRSQVPHAHVVPPRQLQPPLPPDPPKPPRGFVRGQ
jgi:cytochrome c2